MDDKGLVEQVQQGNVKAFEMIFKSFYKPLCNYAFRFVRDSDLAQQLVQDVFFHIWEKHETFRVTSNLQGYLLFAIRNECLKYIRHTKIEQRYAEKMISEHDSSEGYEQDPAMFSELSQTIEATLQMLPERTRKIFMMSRFEKLRYADIAIKLGVSVKTVESNMGKALKTFRETLSEMMIK